MLGLGSNCSTYEYCQMPSFTFKRGERLKSRKVIKQLFSEGESFSAYPLRLVYIELPEEEDSAFPVQVSLTVSKRKFGRAVDRNRIKRLLREAWRAHKKGLYTSLSKKGKRYAFMLIYTGKEELPLNSIEAGVKKMIYKFYKQTKHNP